MAKFIFNTGKGTYGLVAFQQNLVKICIEDTEWFNEKWETVFPNDYSEFEVRYFLNLMKTIKENNGKISYDFLKIIVNNKVEGINKTIFCDFLDAIKERELTKEDIEDIKDTYMYFGLYASMVSQANNTLDWAKSGFKFKKEILNKYELVKVGMERNDKIYNNLLKNIGEIKNIIPNEEW